MYEAYITNYELGEMHESAMEGVLNLIPKAGKDQRLLKNLRPITLLNIDYKIIEKVISNRMLTALQQIVSSDQTGFLPNRRITCNIRKILDIMHHTDRENIPAIVLSIDYQKVFDKIEMTAIMGGLNYFQFAPFIIRWIQILYNKFRLRVQNNGHFSPYFPVSRGIHQGGCCSTAIFLVIAELLAINIRSHESIKGIPVNEIMNLLNQFADDTDMTLEANQSNLNIVFNEMETFRKHTGCTINYDKTSIYRIGSLKHTDMKLITKQTVCWTNEPINILGIWISHDRDEMQYLNYEPILNKTKSILSSWSNRFLSLIGKTNVINTLIASLFIYRFMVLPNMSEVYLKKFESEMNKFLWNNKRAKITMKTLQLDKKDGGLRLTNLRIRERSIKISWVKILENDEKMANLAYNSMAPFLKQWIFDCNLKADDVKYLQISDPFWEDVLYSWCLYNYERDINAKNDAIIWLNSDIRINGEPIMWKKQFSLGLFRVSQLFENKKLLSIREAYDRFGLSFLDFHSLHQAIPSNLKERLRMGQELVVSSKYAEALDNVNLPKKAYEYFIHKEACFAKKDRWTVLLNREINSKEMSKSFKEIYITTNIPKYRSFQYRSLHT